MPSNSEMYDRGATDAAQDDLNAFYYQHYYYYRRGYDDTRRQQRGGSLAFLPIWLMLMIVVALALVGALAFWLLAPSGQPVSPAPAPTQAVTRTIPTATPVVLPSPSPTASATPTPAPTLHVRGRARVTNVGASPLRARAKPGLVQSNRVVAHFPQGAEVLIAGDAGEGWSVERSADGLVFLEPLP